MEIVAAVVGGYLVFAAIEIFYFKKLEKKLQSETKKI